MFSSFQCFVLVFVAIQRRHSKASPVTIVKKSRSRVFSSSSTSSVGKSGRRLDDCASQSFDVKSASTSNPVTCPNGVVLDLEDCCQMTLCDQVTMTVVVVQLFYYSRILLLLQSYITSVAINNCYFSNIPSYCARFAHMLQTLNFSSKSFNPFTMTVNFYSTALITTCVIKNKTSIDATEIYHATLQLGVMYKLPRFL